MTKYWLLSVVRNARYLTVYDLWFYTEFYQHCSNFRPVISSFPMNLWVCLAGFGDKFELSPRHGSESGSTGDHWSGPWSHWALAPDILLAATAAAQESRHGALVQTLTSSTCPHLKMLEQMRRGKCHRDRISGSAFAVISQCCLFLIFIWLLSLVHKKDCDNNEWQRMSWLELIVPIMVISFRKGLMTYWWWISLVQDPSLIILSIFPVTFAPAIALLRCIAVLKGYF